MFTRAAIWMRLDPRYIAVFLWSALIIFMSGEIKEFKKKIYIYTYTNLREISIDQFSPLFAYLSYSDWINFLS